MCSKTAPPDRECTAPPSPALPAPCVWTLRELLLVCSLSPLPQGWKRSSYWFPQSWIQETLCTGECYWRLRVHRPWFLKTTVPKFGRWSNVLVLNRYLLFFTFRMIVRLTMRWNHFASWTFTSMRHFSAMAMGENSFSICCRYHFSLHQPGRRENTGPFAGSPTGASAPSPGSPCPPLPFSGSRVLLPCSPHTFSYLESPVPCRRSELNHTN